jgi:hypothetical protein
MDVYYTWSGRSDLSQMTAYGRLTSLEEVSDIPEPPTAMLLLAGALAIAGMHKAGRRRLLTPASR